MVTLMIWLLFSDKARPKSIGGVVASYVENVSNDESSDVASSEIATLNALALLHFRIPVHKKTTHKKSPHRRGSLATRPMRHRLP